MPSLLTHGLINQRMIATNRNGLIADDLLLASEDSAPKVFERLVQQAEQARASDIHLQMIDRTASISFRIDGVMAAVNELPPTVSERVFGRIKFLARLKTYQEALPQDGRIDKAEVGSQHDLRVATYPTVTGEKIVVRLFQGVTGKLLDQLDFPNPGVAQVKKFLRQTSGLMLLTGPAGTGKTTTIYACLRELAASGERHIITIEDPVEQIIGGIMQTEVNEPMGLGFAKAARHLLRQDPQVLVIGEIRDHETADLAIRAALTGHLVISTLHAGSCRGVFERLAVLCRDHSAIAASLELVINQKLLRRLCGVCQGKGCADCLQTGYRGRLPVIELFRLTDDLRASVAACDLARIIPNPSLADNARWLLQQGLTNQREVERVLGAQPSHNE